jgi:acyl-CoA thioester hydrolase
MQAAKADRPAPLGREAFARFVAVSTRWSDNDPYGHINNAAYYLFFDAAVNAILVDVGLLDPTNSAIIGLVAETNCVYFSSLAFPDAVEIGVAVEALGRSSVRYVLGAFKAGAPHAAAQGRYTHVYVQRATQKPTPIPDGHRRLMESLQVAAAGA